MRRQILVGCSATFAGAFDFGFTTLAAPALDRDLALGAVYPWIFSAGALAYGACVMPAGALGVRPHRLLAAGLALAAAGTVTVAVAPGAPAALVGRTLFGAGGGVAAAPALALLAGIEPAALRRAAFARLGGAVAGGFTTGVLLAALALPALGWRPLLLAFGAALLALAVLALRVASGRTQAAAGGAWWFGAATVALTAALWWTGPAPAGAAALLVAAAVPARSGWRRTRGWLARGRGAALAICAAGAATTASGVGATVLLGRELAAEDGVILGAFGLAILPAIAAARRLTRRAGAVAAAAAGLGLQGIGIAGLVTAPPAVIVPLLLFGAGHVIANAGVADAVTALAGAHAQPAGGLLVTAQYAGGGAGAVTVLAVAGEAGASAGFLLAASLAALGVVALALLRRRRPVVALTAGAGRLPPCQRTSSSPRPPSST